LECPDQARQVRLIFSKKMVFAVLRFGDQTDIGLKKMGLPINEKK